MVNKKFWKDRKVFVTGVTGLLGASLVCALVDNGAEVVGLIRDWVPRSNLLLEGSVERMVTVRGEVEDLALLERVVNEYEIETVFHLAAQTIVGTANRSPLSTFEANIKGTWNVLEACRRNGAVKRIVAASSDKAYGEHEVLPYTEEAPLKGRFPYDVSKSCSDLLALSYHKTYNLPVAVTRCGNFYGAGDLNFNRLVPGTIRSVINGEPPVIRSDGKFIRDYIFIEDAVEAYLCLAEKMEDKRVCGEAFNFSNEIQVTVLEMTKKILKIMEREDLAPVVLNEAVGEIKHQYLSATKAREVLGWEPKYTLEEGLATTVRWYRKFFETLEGR